MRKKIFSKTLILLLIFCGVIFFIKIFGAQADVTTIQDINSPDVIAVRVSPNSENLSPLDWYDKYIEIKGSPQKLLIDGYEAIRDGRSVYVNAARAVGPTWDNKFNLETYIFIISYNQDAAKDTTDIFAQLLTYWNFTNSLDGYYGYCSSRGATCQTNDDCLVDNKEKDKNVNPASIKNECVVEGITNVSYFCRRRCLNDRDCSGDDTCDSLKARTVRDTRRLSDLAKMNTLLSSYFNNNSDRFPDLMSGSYVQNKTISTWPSWNNVLGQKLGSKIPLDPINKLGDCSGYDPITCWDQANLRFATDFNKPVLPFGSHAYYYALQSDRYKLSEKNNLWKYFGSKLIIKSALAETNNPKERYKLCANFESQIFREYASSGITFKMDNLPKVHNCDEIQSVVFDRNVPRITCGNMNGLSGKSFSGYFAVESDLRIKSYEILPKNPAAWSDWTALFWVWKTGVVGPRIEPTNNYYQKKVTAAKSGKSGHYDFTVRLTYEGLDLNGNATDKQVSKDCGIDIYNNRVCDSDECGIVFDGNYIDCGDCKNGDVCVNNRCKPKYCPSGESIDYYGDNYKTVWIDMDDDNKEDSGECWMKQSLRTKQKPDNSDLLPNNDYVCPPNESDCSPDCASASSKGFLYKWASAMNNDFNEGARGICPDGWHVPSRVEWHNIESFYTTRGLCDLDRSLLACEPVGMSLRGGGNYSWGGFPGTNISGFSAYASGYKDENEYKGCGADRSFNIWTSSNVNNLGRGYVFGWVGNNNSEGVAPFATDNSNYYMSVRCVKD